MLLMLDEDCTITLPAEVLQHLGLEDGGEVDAELLPRRQVRLRKATSVVSGMPPASDHDK